jgi:hypothetical protein
MDERCYQMAPLFFLRLEPGKANSVSTKTILHHQIQKNFSSIIAWAGYRVQAMDMLIRTHACKQMGGLKQGYKELS